MKKQLISRLCACLVVALCGMPLMAQGVIVYQKDGTKVKFPYELIDSIVTYNYGEDVEDEPVTPPATAPAGVEAVDLGLSVKWASCNIGAESPEEYGDHFAWGETTTKSDYSSSSSVTYGLSLSELESRGIIGSDGNLTVERDAATASWGGSWRMPTLDEMKELLDNCTWEWTVQKGVNGRKVTGPNGNSIFLPAAGYRENTSFYSVESGGFYWSTVPYEDYSEYAHCLYFYSDYFGWNAPYNRFYGRTIRPVSE